MECKGQRTELVDTILLFILLIQINQHVNQQTDHYNDTSSGAGN
jgi:hypothetical protein